MEWGESNDVDREMWKWEGERKLLEFSSFLRQNGFVFVLVKEREKLDVC